VEGLSKCFNNGTKNAQHLTRSFVGNAGTGQERPKIPCRGLNIELPSKFRKSRHFKLSVSSSIITPFGTLYSYPPFYQ
jgi:hypothetical protein